MPYGVVISRHMVAGLLLLCTLGFAREDFALDPPPAPAFVYTVAKQYDPLAWIHGAERFPSGAFLLIQDANGRRPLLTGFSASADPTVSFDAKNVLFSGKKKADDPWQIWEVGLADGVLRRVTYSADDCIRPFYLPDDRIVYARKMNGRFIVEAAALNSKPLQLTYGPGNYLPTDILRDGRILFESTQPFGGTVPELFTVYSDGSGVEAYRCDHGKARHSGKQLNSGDIVFASHSGLARFTSALAESASITAPAGEYAGDVIETPSGDWIFPWRTNAKSPFHLMLWKPGLRALQLVAAESIANTLQPTLIVERALPKKHPSGLHDWPIANLLCLNAYTSKYKFAEGSAHSVRLYTRDDAGAAKLLGTAPVEPDGSFFVQVNGDQPVQIELLDASGKTLKRESGWFWARRGEQRACVGCHAGPETSPENAVPMVLLKSTTPADMTGAAAHSSSGGH
jgi:hypothetical protein